jgi:DNA replication protein DnaD
MKDNTIYFHIGNDYGLYNIAVNNEWNLIEDFYKSYGVDVNIEQLKEWWFEDHIDDEHQIR